MCHTITKMYRVGSVFFKILVCFYFSLGEILPCHRFLPRSLLFPENGLCWLILTSTPLYLSFREHKDSFELCSEGFFPKCTHWAKLCLGLQHCIPIEQVQRGYVGITEADLLTAIIINKEEFSCFLYKGPFLSHLPKATSWELNSYSEHPGGES